MIVKNVSLSLYGERGRERGRGTNLSCQPSSESSVLLTVQRYLDLQPDLLFRHIVGPMERRNLNFLR